MITFATRAPRHICARLPTLRRRTRTRFRAPVYRPFEMGPSDGSTAAIARACAAGCAPRCAPFMARPELPLLPAAAWAWAWPPWSWWARGWAWVGRSSRLRLRRYATSSSGLTTPDRRCAGARGSPAPPRARMWGTAAVLSSLVAWFEPWRRSTTCTDAWLQRRESTHKPSATSDTRPAYADTHRRHRRAVRRCP